MSTFIPLIGKTVRLYGFKPGNVANAYGDIYALEHPQDVRPFAHGHVWVEIDQAFDATSYRWRAIERRGSLVKLERTHPRRK